jgi:hypothetical protein
MAANNAKTRAIVTGVFSTTDITKKEMQILSKCVRLLDRTHCASKTVVYLDLENRYRKLRARLVNVIMKTMAHIERRRRWYSVCEGRVCALKEED